MPDSHQDDPLEDFAQRDLTFAEETKRVYVAGKGPAVVVMTEMPGITPTVARFTRWVRDAGYTVYLPSLFGTDGVAPTMDLTVEVMGSGCVRREFKAFANGTPSPMASRSWPIASREIPIAAPPALPPMSASSATGSSAGPSPTPRPANPDGSGSHTASSPRA